MPHWARRLGGAWSIRAHFLVFGAILVFPLAALSGFLLFQVAERDRDQLEQRSLQIAAGVAADLDRELQRRTTILLTLATSPTLAQGNFAGFHAQASAALEGDRTGIFLIDRSFRQKLNTYVVFGTELPSYGAPQTAQRVFEQKTPQVSDFFTGRVTRRPAFDIAIPVRTEGEVEYVLAMGLEPFILQQLLHGLKLPREWTISIADRNGTILARSREQDKFIGTSLPPALSTQRPGTASRVLTLENEAVLRATAHSQVSGWQVAVNFPETAAKAALRTNLLLLGIWSVLALVLAMAGAAWFARIVAQPIQAASKAAAALAHDHAVIPFHSHVTEANHLVAALQRAGLELSKARDQQRLLLEELNHRVKNILTIVIAMTQRSLSSPQLKEPRELLIRRLRSLARSQDLIMASRWEGAALARIVETELGPYAGRIAAQGPDIVLNPRATQAITMILHELATNAAKYGALSAARGQVHLTWGFDQAAGSLTLHWQEIGGPIVKSPAHKGFGTTLLEGALPEASTDIAYNSDGLIYRLEVPVAAGLTAAELPGESRVVMAIEPADDAAGHQAALG